MQGLKPIVDAGNRTPPDFDLRVAADVQTLRECGADVRDGRLLLGGAEVEFSAIGADAFGRDGYRVVHVDGRVIIQAASRAGRLSALLAAGEAPGGGKAPIMRRLHFNRRFYKHEVWRRGERGESLAPYTPRFWAGLCRELVRRHFNGVAIYLSGEPFPMLADYGSYERHAALPGEVRARNRARFREFLDAAARYGLETLLQQSLTRFPASLSDALGLPYFARRDCFATVADFKHPQVYAFHRELYANFFRDLPGLSRLMLNFEAAPNSTEFCQDVLLPSLAALPRPPDLHMRLWYMTHPESLCEWIAAYPGDCMVSHKVMDTMDAYLHPAPDSRIREWKKWFAARILRVNWNYLIGPCHDCGSNISRRHWSDPEFMHTLLGRMRAIGSDGFNFHSVNELLAGDFASGEVVDAHEREMARLNRFHLDAVVNAVRGGTFDADEWVSRTADTYGLKRPAARRVFRAMRDTSQAEILHLLQFPLTTSEGYAVDARRLLAQHPLFHPPANLLLDRGHRDDPHALWSFIDKKLPSHSYPPDLQTLIDYADPAQPKSARNPERLAKEMAALGVSSHRTAIALGRQMGEVWVAAVDSNRRLAEACAHDIRAGIALFRLYFPQSPAASRRTVRASMAELRGLQSLIRRHGMPTIYMAEPYAPERDLDALERLDAHLGRAYPVGAFRAYAASVKTYNDVRRHMRPWRIYSGATVARVAALLRRSEHLAAKAVAASGGEPAFAVRLESWRGFVKQERVWLTEPPTIACGREWAPWQPLVHDNCFGYGGFAVNDFLGFFEDVPRDKGLQLRMSVRRDAKALEVRLREDGVDGNARQTKWQSLAGQHDLSGVARVFLDVGAKGVLLQQWSAIPVGPVVTTRPMITRGRNRFNLQADRLAEGVKATYAYEEGGWEVSVRLSFAALGHAPRPNETWKLNVASNAPVKRNHAVAWCRSYEVGPGNPSRMGTIQF